jgi:hypothetical protein
MIKIKIQFLIISLLICISISAKSDYLSQTNNQFVIASTVKAKTIEIETQLLELISQKDLDYLKETSDSSGLMTRTITDKGYQQEQIIQASIQADSISVNGQALTIGGQSVTNALSAGHLNTQLLHTLSSQGDFNQQLQDAGINLQNLAANNRHWDESITTLSSTGALIVKALVTYFTVGVGTGLVEAGSTIIQAAIDAAMQSLIEQVAMSVVSGAITGDMNFDIEAIVKASVVAGATSYASNYISSEKGFNIVKDSVQYDVINTVADAGIKTAANGGSFTDNLKNSAINTIRQNLAKDIGAADLNELTHKLAHAGLGCGLASAKGGDCASGAVGAVVAEFAAELYRDEQLQNNLPKNKQELVELQREIKLIGELSSIATAGLFELDAQSAFNAGSNGYSLCG